jgi:predicted transcriptional regulator
MALVFGFLGFLGFLGYASNPMLLFIAFFIWIGASQENNAAEVKAGLDSIRVKDAMVTTFQILQSGDELNRAVELILAGSQHDFPVLDQGQVMGVLTRKQLMVALAQHGRNWPVTQVMTRDVPALDSEQLVTDVIPELQNHECQTLPVLSQGRLVGLLTSENVGEFLMIRTALKPSNETGFIRR